MKVVIDTNILFSALINSNSNIGNLILNGSKYFEFYTVNYLLYEIDKHYDKILKISKLEKINLDELLRILLNKIQFYNEELIPITTRENAFKLVHNIDLNDLYFIALAEHLNAKLWTGDKKLVKGLVSKHYNKLINTQELKEMYFEMKFGN